MGCHKSPWLLPLLDLPSFVTAHSCYAFYWPLRVLCRAGLMRVGSTGAPPVDRGGQEEAVVAATSGSRLGRLEPRGVNL